MKQQESKKLNSDDFLEEKVIQDKRSMNLCITYKEFARPEFFQGPTYVLFKEESKIKNHKYADHKEADDDHSYQVASLPPVKPNSAGE